MDQVNESTEPENVVKMKQNEESEPESSSKRSRGINVQMEPKQLEDIHPLTSSAVTTRQLTNSWPKEETKELNETNAMDIPNSLKSPIESWLLDYMNDRAIKRLDEILDRVRSQRAREDYEAYPKLMGTGIERKYLLGPYGTKISYEVYSEIDWNTPQEATCQLLRSIFSDAKLRASKLDPAIVRDIIVCVLNKVGGTEQLIRNTITKKCKEMCRNYKRFTKVESDEE